MKAHEVIEILSKITYKPGYVLKVHQSNGLVTFNVRLETLDADLAHDPMGTKHMIALNFVSAFNPLEYDVAEHLVQDVKELIRNFEIHEMNEWLKYDGTLVTQPHPEKMYAPVRR